MLSKKIGEAMSY